MIEPATQGHNLLVKVLAKSVVLNRQEASGSTLKLEECLVGDETGRMYFTARNDQCDETEVGDVIELRNAKINMYNGHMRIAIDKWGLIISDTDKYIEGDIPCTNYSDIKFEHRYG
eukprot:IDg1603t1